MINEILAVGFGGLSIVFVASIFWADEKGPNFIIGLLFAILSKLYG